MFAKIKTTAQTIRQFVGRLRDVRVIGMLLFLVVVLMISWSGVKVIDTNYGLQRQISELEQHNEVQRLSNENLRLKNDYFKSKQYLELAARQNFGLAAPGETVLIVPRSVALKHTIEPLAPEEPAKVTINKKTPVWQQNLQAWMDFFLHRERIE